MRRRRVRRDGQRDGRHDGDDQGAKAVCGRQRILLPREAFAFFAGGRSSGSDALPENIPGRSPGLPGSLEPVAAFRHDEPNTLTAAGPRRICTGFPLPPAGRQLYHSRLAARPRADDRMCHNFATRFAGDSRLLLRVAVECQEMALRLVSEESLRRSDAHQDGKDGGALLHHGSVVTVTRRRLFTVGIITVLLVIVLSVVFLVSLRVGPEEGPIRSPVTTHILDDDGHEAPSSAYEPENHSSVGVVDEPPPWTAARSDSRTSATARTMGSRPHGHSDRSVAVRCTHVSNSSKPRSAIPTPPGWPSYTNTVGTPV